DRSKVNGVINAESERQARELLREQELLPTKLSAVAAFTKPVKKGQSIFSGFQGIFQRIFGVGSKEKIAFTRNMEMMLKSGIPLTEALFYFENYMQNPVFKPVVSQIRKDILAGYSFSQALGKHKKLFSDVYLNVTKAGETSGELEESMSRLAELMMKQDKLKMKVISTMVYPVLVIVIMAIVLLVMFLFVLPTFADIYKQQGVELPLLTQILLAISHAMQNWWFIVFPMMGLAGYGVFIYCSKGAGKILWEKLMLTIPVVGELVKYVNNAHFISTFNVAFSAGLPITDAIYLGCLTVRHTQMRSAFQQVNVKIQAGQRLAEAMAQTGYVPDIVLLMLSTGDETGELEKMLLSSHSYLEDEIDHRIGILTAMMEPVLLLVLGTVVLFIALAIYMPMFSMYENI
ncbi:MAG: type II secretion system F family protein, partial [Vampirovibrio sp.]|nr:type II secretion system F family protein [Vampirovibrio sp.]